MTEIAYCYASGVVGFGDKIERGTLPIGRLQCDRAAFTVHCRLAYDGKTWLVPGIPEAPDQMAGIDALRSFQVRMAGLGLILV